MLLPRSRWAHTLLVAAAIGVTALLGPFGPVARAASGSCDSILSQPFLPWADPAYYELVPGGDFENATWTLTGSAERVPGSEPYAATGKLGHWSLSLPVGGSASSPSTCVPATDPTLRFFIAGSGTIEVELVYGGQVILSGDVAGGGGWVPTPVLLTGSAITGLTTGTAEASVRLTALGGDAQVDDVFIDPWNRG